MKRLIIIFILSFYVSLSSAQIYQSSYSIYEYGGKLTSCETNFKNLFKFWTPQYVSNARDTKLISWQFVEAITNKFQIYKYSNLLTRMDILTISMRTSMEIDHKSQKVRRECYAYIETFDQRNARHKAEKKPGVKIGVFEKNQKKTRKRLMELLKMNDKIYVIKIQKGSNLYDNYVVCDPKTYKVKFDNLFWGITLWK